MTAPARRTSRTLFATALAVLLLAACGGSEEPVASATPTPSATETTPPPPPPPPPVDPLTGVAPQPTQPLVALKVDNSPFARPFHRGLEAAAVVYVELVEGGATRFLAMYSQPFDAEVGPVRSFRESDVELLRQYGKPAVGFSGANGGVLATFRDAVRAGQMVEVSYENRPDLYRLAERRKDARNFFAVPSQLAAAGEGAAPATGNGFGFAEPPPAGTPAGGARVVFSDRETVDVAYDPATQRYSLSWAGAPIAGAAPANVVVLQVPVRDSGYRDVTGAVTPYSTTVGSGPAQVLRDGLVVPGTWTRPDPAAGTTLTDAAGAPLALKPGATWVLLQPAGLPFTPR